MRPGFTGHPARRLRNNRLRGSRLPPLPTRHERRLLRVCGLAAVKALFATEPARVERLFFEPRLRAALAPDCAALARARKPYREVAPAELARIAGTPLHGGVAAIARPRPIAVLDPTAIAGWARERRPVLILDGVGNPHNLGAIARSAAFFGVARLLLADRPDQALPSDASYRVAEGGLEHIILSRAPIPAALDDLRQHFRIIGAAVGQGDPMWRWHADKPVALILGNEETGIGPGTLARCDDIVTIPGSGRIQSLNVAAAAAILLYALSGGSG
jgi:RNA methyltransferase, TrmH family